MADLFEFVLICKHKQLW